VINVFFCKAPHQYSIYLHWANALYIRHHQYLSVRNLHIFIPFLLLLEDSQVSSLPCLLHQNPCNLLKKLRYRNVIFALRLTRTCHRRPDLSSLMIIFFCRWIYSQVSNKGHGRLRRLTLTMSLCICPSGQNPICSIISAILCASAILVCGRLFGG
jgi:hypothetical protein